MNDNSQMASAPGSSLIPDSISVITTLHFAIMAIFAALVIFGIIWGLRLKSNRKAAAREVAEDNANLAEGRDTHPGPSEPAPAAPEAVDPAPAHPAPAPSPRADHPIADTAVDARSTDDEPIAAAAPLAASPATEAAAPAPDAAHAIPVTTLKGLGPKVAARLADLGITDARQLAALDEGEAATLDADLGSFSGRMARDRWIEQARLLAAGDTAGYEATFGKL